MVDTQDMVAVHFQEKILQRQTVQLHMLQDGLQKMLQQQDWQLAYAIGVAQPVSILVETFGTGIVSDEKISEAIAKTFDLRPGAIIKDLDLRRPIYRKTAAYGHFGREDEDFTWEKINKIDDLLKNIQG